ncbi:O-phosphoseryl-tRNA(Sec) selenium transferase-like [Oscarella lobularis]|uniref:O-phosphoseryl-tRNA(Sec) selenium transferase-like n=1 Tax=Oscarella lobularis TaxID=121494 RepID=UPI003313E2BD
MNVDTARGIIPAAYLRQASDAKAAREALVRHLLEQRKLPLEGWTDDMIEMLLRDLAQMDSNNFPGNVGVGEREARIYSTLVSQRHFRLGHGIGRSGDVTAVQPKAAGSSLLAKITNCLLLDLFRQIGIRSAGACLLLPMATGMSLVLVFLTLKSTRPSSKYILWPRIDQKSCFKCMITAGCQPIVIENLLNGDELTTDLTSVEAKILELGPENITCLHSTTSCFAPRVPDKIVELAILCKRYGIPHVVNNAYGLQSTKCIHLLEEGNRLGRIDAFVQSTDKNFLVPVGGAIVAGFNKEFIDLVAKTYPGRASATPSIDVFITLLSMGVQGYIKLLSDRRELFKYLADGLRKLGEKHGEKVLATTKNQISLAMSLSSIKAEALKVSSSSLERDPTEIGSMLFTRFVSGTRVIVPGKSNTIGLHTFQNWGSHLNDEYPCPYLTAAAAIGLTKPEVDSFLKRLEKVITKFKRERRQ